MKEGELRMECQNPCSRWLLTINRRLLTSSTFFSHPPLQALALRLDGAVFAWGDNADGQLGTSDRSGADVPLAPPKLQVHGGMS